MKKIHGIPAILLVCLIVCAVAVATFTAIYTLMPTVQYPTSESASESFSVASGYSFTKTMILDLALPGTYDLTYKLSGDTGDILSSESATIIIDLDEDFSTTGDQTTKVITTLDGTVTFNDVTDTDGQVAQKITIVATAKDATLMTVSWVTGDQALTLGSAVTSLVVSMEPVKG